MSLDLWNDDSKVLQDNVSTHPFADSEEEEEIREFLLLEQTFEQEQNQLIDQLSNSLQMQSLADKSNSNVEPTKSDFQTTDRLISTTNENKQEENDDDDDDDQQSTVESEIRLPSSLMSESSSWTHPLMSSTATASAASEEREVIRRNAKVADDGRSTQVRFHCSPEPEMNRNTQQRPLTIYLPNPDQHLNLLNHIQTLGHDLDLLQSHLKITADHCSGYLYKQKMNSVHGWQKRFFHFDRLTKKLSYFGSENECRKNKKASCEIKFESIENVYVDHGRSASKAMAVKSSRPVDRLKRLQLKWTSRSNHRHVFVVKTHDRNLILSTFVAELMRVWIDVIFTGAQAYIGF